LTPTRDSAVERSTPYAQGGTPLTMAVQMFPTPSAASVSNDTTVLCSSDGWTKPNKLGWAVAAAMFPTPQAGKVTDKDEASWRARRERGDVATPPLALAVRMIPTPTVGDKAGRGSWSDAADAHDAGRGEPRNAVAAPAQHAAAECGGGRAAERRLGGAADGMARWLDQTAAGYWAGDWETQPRLAQGQANRVARLRALGNGQVPQTAAMAFQILMQRYKDKP